MFSEFWEANYPSELHEQLKRSRLYTINICTFAALQSKVEKYGKKGSEKDIWKDASV